MKWGLVLAVLTSSLLMSDRLAALNCTPDSITLSSQAEVDSFEADHGAGCDTIVSNLTITGASITNLMPLSNLTGAGFGSHFVIDGTSVTSLAGLENLLAVYWFEIKNNAQLTTIGALSNLGVVAGPFFIQANAVLTSLDGLGGLTYLSGGALWLQNNPSLADLSGISGLVSINASLVISNNDALTDLDDLSGLQNVSSSITIQDNDGLGNIGGLSGLTGFRSTLYLRNNSVLTSLGDLSSISKLNGLVISNNDALPNLDGLSGLTALGNGTALSITHNDNLTNINALANVESAQWNVELQNNFALDQCGALQTLLDDVDDGQPGPGPGGAGIPDVGGDVTISGNLSGCNSVAEIVAGGATAFLIPRTPDPVTVDGICDLSSDGEYHFALDLKATIAGVPAQIYVNADADNIYLCATNILLGEKVEQFTSLYIDPDGDGGALADMADRRWRAFFEDGSSDAQRGDGSGGYEYPGHANFEAANGNFLPSSFTNAEYRIGRDVLNPNASAFRMQFMLHWRNAVGDDEGWPDDFDWNTPDVWPYFQIDDDASGLPRPDASDPSVIVNLFASRPIFVNSQITLRAASQDDVDLDRTEILIDGVVVHECVHSGMDDRHSTCSFNPINLTVGPHHYSARVYDHRGRTRTASGSTFIVHLDGEVPTIAMERDQLVIPSGGHVNIKVTASDPSGIKRIVIVPYNSLNIPAKTCNYPFGSPNVECNMTIAWQANQNLLKLKARAVDQEEMTSETPFIHMLFDQGGADSDGDGISDAAELNFFCLSPFNPDTDGDTLQDGWELLGLSFSDGDYIDLPQLGAQPCRKDLFVQLDYEVGADFSETELQGFVNLFQDHGMTLHIEPNERPLSPDPNNPLGSVAAAATKDIQGNYYFHPKRNWTHRYVYSRNKSGRSGAWGRYITIDHNVSDTPYRFVHEVGHAMGLGHGGNSGTGAQFQTDGLIYYDYQWDSTNDKPQHMSVSNYRYNIGDLCYDTSQRKFVGRLNYSLIDMPELDETALDERSSSDISVALRSLDCGSNPDLIPAMTYSCEDPDPNNVDDDGTPWRYYVITDALGPISRRRQGGQWQYSNLPSHNLGIDFNCDGVVSNLPADTVDGNLRQLIPGEVCDGVDNDNDGNIDEGCDRDWSGRAQYGSRAEWPTIPVGHDCNILYSENSATYPQPLAYRTEIKGVDCKLTTASGNAPAQWEAESEPRDKSVSSLQSHDGIAEEHEHVEEEFVLADLPGLEFCDGSDNDGNGEIDEGCPDTDSDNMVDAVDNCPRTSNPDQMDLDVNQLGDLCQFPAISGLSLEGKETVRLSWQVSTPDVLGFNVYRLSANETEPSLINGNYPTTTELEFIDSSLDLLHDPHRYWVAPVNLKGLEGIPVSVDNSVLFEDGFE